MKIVTITSEISPFSKTGGLADVTRSLSKSLKRLGHEVAVITPLYGKVINKKKHKLKLVFENIDIKLDKETSLKVNFYKGYLMHNLPVYFIENKRYFSRKKSIYVSAHENLRFLIFNKASLRLLELLKFKPDIIHCHDWQTGLVPYFLKRKPKAYKFLQNTKTVFTIHNLIFQLGRNWWEIPPEKKDFGRKKLPLVSGEKIEYINFTKRAILSADAVSTVSEQYREEIMTRRFGQDLHRILKNREAKLYGIVNGIDYNAYNPAKDKSLKKKYDLDSVEVKKVNKRYLQKKFGLPVLPEVPLFCTTSRITFQKGFGLILDIIYQLMGPDAQMIVIGAGDKNYIKSLKKVERQFPNKFKIIPSHEKNQKYETLVYAGSDFFLLPSNHEPCGINQLIAMRYGCVPIVRKIGGLQDTVENFDPITNPQGSGFSFVRENKMSFYAAIVRALETFKYKDIWQGIIKRAMQKSSSWEIPAKKYELLYKKVKTMK